jgi:predicted phosphodiesterase
MTRRILVIPDLHAPYHDAAAFDLVEQAARKSRLTDVVVIGDFVDCLAVSAHPKTSERKYFLSQEIETAGALLRRVRMWAPRLHVTEGNHETRLQRYIMDHAPELADTHPTVREMLGIEKREWTAYRDHMFLGNVGFTHDLGHSGPQALNQTLAAFGTNIVFGHTHRLGIVYDGNVDGSHRVAMNVGWLGDYAEVTYMHRSKMKSWQHGFGFIRQEKSGISHMQAVPIVRGECVVDGKLFK